MKSNMVSRVTDMQCSGCGACVNGCPKDAVKMEYNKEGFLFPVISEEKCSDCGLCAEKCPALSYRFNNNESPGCYAVWASDKIRAVSSSGGMFTLLADYVFERGGYVCGAVWSEDFRSVYHTLVSDREGVSRMRGSKYIQSDTKSVYIEIRRLLDEDEWVLFTGCPCQVAGLYTFLGSDCEKLLTADLVCHAVSSVKAWNKFLDGREDEFGSKTVGVSFRDKTVRGWSTTTAITTEDGRKFETPGAQCGWFKGFLSGLINRKTCGECPYTRTPRTGDFTLADFWGIHLYNSAFDDRKGTSLVLTNSKKGNAVFGEMRERMALCEEVPFSFAKEKNGNLHIPTRTHRERKAFFEMMDALPFEKIIKAIIDRKFDVGLVGVPNSQNKGGALIYYSLYKNLLAWGYSVFLIDRPLFAGHKHHLHYSWNNVPYPKIIRGNDFISIGEFNGKCDVFLVGGDALMNMDTIRDILADKYNTSIYTTLDHIQDIHPKIAYAPSFAHDDFHGSDETRGYISYHLKRFDWFSIREKSGVSLLKSHFGVEAEQVLDPVLIANREWFEELAKEHVNEQPHIFAYILDIDADKEQIIHHVSSIKKLKAEVYTELFFDYEKDDWNLSFCAENKIENFLGSLISGEFIVTDSYHGMIFAIIFKKPFIAIINPVRGADRFISLADIFGLRDRIIETFEELQNKPELLTPPDWERIERILTEKAGRSRDWLKNALESAKKLKKPYSTLDMVRQEMSVLLGKSLSNQIAANAYAAKNDLIRETFLQRYLKKLANAKHSLLIIICVKDTPGTALDGGIAAMIMGLGFRNSLTDKHWCGYIGILDGGLVTVEAGPSECEEYCDIRIGSHEIVCISSPFTFNNRGVIAIDGTDWSEGGRGLNIVVMDKTRGTVIDSVCFDTHVNPIECWRGGNKL